MTRRDAIGLGGAVAIGWAAGRVLMRTVPLGRDLSGDSTAAALLADRTAPAYEVPRPTLTLVVFGDYQCPVCKRAELEMDAAVARDGHVRVSYRELPIFGAVSERAARVALASARQGLYPTVHGRLMAERRVPGEAVLRETVEQAGGDWARIAKDEAATEPHIAHSRRDAFALGIKGTPAYLAGPLLVLGALDENGFMRAFAQGRALLAKTRQ